MDHEVSVQGVAGEVAERARDLLCQICAAREMRILRGAVSPDHIHMLVVAPDAVGAGEAGAIPEGAVVAIAPAGISAPAVLGPASGGARIVLCGGGRGRRADGDNR
jgi:Transposase IS200 like